MAPYITAPRPKPMPPSICAAITSGLMGMPQSTAHTTRSTVTRPLSSTLTSATCATYVLNASPTAMPRPLPLGNGPLLQPALSAASSSTAFMRGSCSSRSRRNANGSFPAAYATSSMNASTAKVVCELPTTRHQSTGTPVLVVDSSTSILGISYAIVAAPSTDVGSMPFLTMTSKGPPAMMDWPTMTCRHPTSSFFSFKPASSL